MSLTVMPLSHLLRQETGFEIVRDVLVKITKAESEGFMTAINLGRCIL